MEEISYQKLKAKLDEVNLIICNLTFSFNSDGEPIYQGEIGSMNTNHKPHIIEGAVTRGVNVRSLTSKGVIHGLWDKVKKSELWMGTYKNYSAVIEYDKKIDRLVKRSLTEKEESEMIANSIY